MQGSCRAVGAAPCHQLDHRQAKAEHQASEGDELLLVRTSLLESYLRLERQERLRCNCWSVCSCRQGVVKAQRGMIAAR